MQSTYIGRAIMTSRIYLYMVRRPSRVFVSAIYHANIYMFVLGGDLALIMPLTVLKTQEAQNATLKLKAP